MKEAERQLVEGMLSTDFYELSAAQVYFRQTVHERPAQFEHFFRSYPDYGKHEAGFCIHAGMGWLLDWMEQVRFREADLEHLRQHRGSQGQPVFGSDFLEWLASHGDFGAISMRSVPEGRVVHPHAPLTVVEGPLAMGQILETALLMALNYQTLIATKAARIKMSAEGQVMLVFPGCGDCRGQLRKRSADGDDG